jgi:uncharacterized RDD family membrane protein YckC
MEGVEARANLAGLGARFIAIIVDGFVLGLIGGVLFSIIREPGGAAGIILGIAYQWYFLTQHNGQTPGKMLMGIRVVKTDGGKISDADAVIRYFGYWLNSLVLLLGWIWAIFDTNRQGWHDKLASTYVVRA